MREPITTRIIAATSPAPVEPINATVLKDALAIADPYNTEGGILSRAIKVSRARLEIYLQRAIIQQLYEQTTEYAEHVRTFRLLPYLISVSSIKGYTEDGTETTIDTSKCDIFLGDNAEVTIPATYHKVVITYTAGYPEGPEMEIIREAITMMARNIYEGKPETIDAPIREMVSPLRRHHV